MRQWGYNMLGVALILGMAVLLLIRVPLAFAFGWLVIIGITLTGLPSSLTVLSAFEGLFSFPLLAVPLFLLAGELMGAGGMVAPLMRLAELTLGRIRGGLGHAIILTSAFFAAMTGSGITAAAAIGKMVMPELEKRGWEKRYIVALVCSSSPLGILIPPSIPLILYGLITGTSIAALFLSTVIPALILIGIYGVIHSFYGTRFARGKLEGAAIEAPPPKVSFARETGHAVPALITPIIILGGIYGGVFTPTEAAGVAVIYSILVGFLIYRRLRWGSLYQILVTTGTLWGVLMLILLAINMLTPILSAEGIPQKLASIMSAAPNKYVTLAFIGLFLLVIGMIMDIFTGTIISAPLLLPVATQIGVSTLQLGGIIGVGMAVGLLTPPVAGALFVGCKISGLRIDQFLPQVTPFLIGAMVTLILTLYFPPLTLWLPRLVLG